MLVAVTVYCTSDPGLTVDTSALAVMFSAATFTVAVQRGSVESAPQSLPVEVEVMVLARMWLPVSGLFTVTE